MFVVVEDVSVGWLGDAVVGPAFPNVGAIEAVDAADPVVDDDDEVPWLGFVLLLLVLSLLPPFSLPPIILLEVGLEVCC